MLEKEGVVTRREVLARKMGMTAPAQGWASPSALDETNCGTERYLPRP